MPAPEAAIVDVIFFLTHSRCLGEPQQSEFSVVKVDAYNGINHYLSQLTNTNMESVEDVVIFNERNRGSEGAWPGDHPAWASGQVCRRLHDKMQLISTEQSQRNFELCGQRGRNLS